MEALTDVFLVAIATKYKMVVMHMMIILSISTFNNFLATNLHNLKAFNYNLCLLKCVGPIFNHFIFCNSVLTNLVTMTIKLNVIS